MKLIDNWKEAYKWMSVNCMALAAAIQGAWIYVPEDMRDKLPEWGVAGTTILLLILGVYGRITVKKTPDA